MWALSGTAKKEKERATIYYCPLRSRRQVSQKYQTKMKLKGYTCLCLRGGFFYIHFPYYGQAVVFSVIFLENIAKIRF